MLTFAGILVVLSPAVLVALFGISTLLRTPVGETIYSRCTAAAVSTGLAAAVWILVAMLMTDDRQVEVNLGDWVRIPAAAEHHAGEPPGGGAGVSPQIPDEPHFHFTMKFMFDRLSIPFVIMTYVLCGVISAFASRYLHRDGGFQRFFLFLSFFLLGMILSSAAGTIETLFFGWELVGLSSALLVAFFHDRRGPVVNGLRVWSIYRLADAAFLIGAMSLHHLSGSGDFSGLAGQGVWPEGRVDVPQQSVLLVGCLFLFAAAGKSALVPFSGWLPRAMEGPTPSSAVFYGALSVHLGAFLLLRISPLLDRSPVLSGLVVLLGAVTCVFAAMAARVQSDIKSSLAFASLIQVSIIVMEIGLGFRYLPLVHIIGHACLRTLQLVRAPSLLKDYNSMINALGGVSEHRSALEQSRYQRMYRFAMNRGNLDSILDEFVVRPFTAVLLWSDRMERRWTNWLSGENK
jgi:NAD(P)H-quinone oxidoreductase subunit 5